MIVVDVNVVLRGLRSRNGASHAILRGMLTGEIAFAASPAVVLEYEDVLERDGILGPNSPITRDDIDSLLDGMCAMAIPAAPRFRFRPFLADPKDDLYIECALAAGAHTIVTHDGDFDHPAVRAFGLRALTAGGFLAARRERSAQ